MKKLNMTVSKKIAVIALTAATAFSFMGCNVTSSSTRTETTTDADGNTTTTTTTTTTENGKTTSETTTETSADDVVKIVATISFDNQTNADFTEFYITSAEYDDWGENILGDDILPVGNVITFDDKFTYSPDNTVWDIMAVDADGTVIEITGIDMTLSEDPENIYLSIEYDDTDGYAAYFIND